MSIKIHRIYSLCLLILATVAASAQRFVNVSLDGAQTVCAITQDDQGMMWIGTDNGLYSYDGYHSYRHYLEHSFSNTRVNALAMESNQLYMATVNGVLQFDVHTGGYVKNTAVVNYQDETKRKTIKDQRVLNMKNKHATYGSDVYALLYTNKGTLVGTISGLYQGKKLIPLTAGAQPLVNALTYDAKRRCYWIGTEGALYCADLQLKNFSKIAELNGNSVKCLAEDGEGKLYIGTDNGLYTLSINNVIEHFVHDSRNAASIPNNIVWACFVDKWQNVWIGTDNGLSHLSTHTYYQYTPLDEITFSGDGNCLHAILQTRDGDWWYGGTNGLIWRGMVWYKQTNKYYPLTHNRVRKIYEDHEGDLWVCTDHGVNLLNRATQQMMNFIVYDKTGKYSTTWAYDVLEDRQGRMWMASYNGGIFVIDKMRLKSAIAKAGAPSALATATCIADYHFSDQGKNALSGLHIGQLVMDGKGRIWASSYNRLDCIDPNSMEVLHPTNSEVVNYLMCDSKGNIWVGNNTEVKCYFTNIPLQGDKFAPKVWKIGTKVSTMCDVEGKIWVITGNECCVIDPVGKSTRFMIPSITPLTAYYSAANHEVVMGGNDGFVTVRSDMAKSAQKGQLLLAGVIVNGKPMQVTILGKMDDDENMLAPRYLKEMVLNSDENSFTLQLTDLPFADHPSEVYAYKLDGSDRDWHYLKNGNIDIAYNGLSYGDYHLTVHMVDGEGNIGEEVYALDISVLPPWYLSLWCKIFYVTALIVFIAWLVSFYFLRKELAEEQRQKAEILDQVNARMDFYKRLSQGLRTAVEHQSFEEVTELINKTLDVNTETEQVSVPMGMLDAGKESLVLSDPLVGNPIQEQKMDEGDRKLLEEITQAIEKNMIDSDFNVTKLQEVVGIGGKQLYRKLKALTGYTPVEYIRDMRMRKAAKLLSAGKFSVSEVMYTVGFSNSSYFSKCFSKAYGMTPTEFMKKS